MMKPHQLALIAADAGYAFPDVKCGKSNIHRCIECKCEIPRGKAGRRCKACRAKEEKK